jgi:uncharacterized surface protein with fasciclin (FAS1) repeats
VFDSSTLCVTRLARPNKQTGPRDIKSLKCCIHTLQMKFTQILIGSAAIFATPVPQDTTSSETNSQQLLQAITAQEKLLGISFRFLKTMVRTYATEIEKYTLPDSNVTVFLPSDDAFFDIGVDDIFNVTKVGQFVQHHGVPYYLNASDIPVDGWSIATTFLGQDIKASKNANQTVNIISAPSTKSAIVANATFGTITAYFVDQILTPPVSVLDTVFQHSLFNFTSLLQSYLDSNSTRITAFKNVTVFVPSELAFRDFVNSTCRGGKLSQGSLKEVVEYHVISGRTYHSSFGEWNNKTITSLNGLNLTASYNGTLVATVNTLPAANVTLPLSNVTTPVNGTTVNSTTTYIYNFLKKEFNATLTLITPSGNATVLQKDVIAKDAVLHIIDRVLVPPGVNVTCL